jgi:hypothetical protein
MFGLDRRGFVRGLIGFVGAALGYKPEEGGLPRVGDPWNPPYPEVFAAYAKVGVRLVVIDDPEQEAPANPEVVKKYGERLERYFALKGIQSTILFLLLVFIPPCKGETKVEKGQAWEVGTRPVVCAVSILTLDEMNTAFRNEDQRELQLLYDQGSIVKLRKGDTLSVIKSHEQRGQGGVKFVECKLLRGNREIRTVFLYKTILVVFCKQVN